MSQRISAEDKRNLIDLGLIIFALCLLLLTFYTLTEGRKADYKKIQKEELLKTYKSLADFDNMTAEKYYQDARKRLIQQIESLEKATK